MRKTRIELVGTELELVASSLSKDRYDQWRANGLPSDEGSDEELDELYELLDANLACGLIPDEDLQLYVNDSPVLDLHTQIDATQNFIVSHRPLIDVSCHCLCAASYSKRAVYGLTIKGKFDFALLHWSAIGYSINDKQVGFILDVTYNGKSLEYIDGQGMHSQDMWLEQV
jgi:hypothetical protein